MTIDKINSGDIFTFNDPHYKSDLYIKVQEPEEIEKTKASYAKGGCVLAIRVHDAKLDFFWKDTKVNLFD